MDENKNQPIKENIKTIHTYSSDMADAVRINEASVIKIALAEQAKKEREALYKKAEGSNGSKVLMLLGGLILIGAAIGGAYYFANKKKIENTPVETKKNIEALISYDDQAFLDMTSATSAIDAANIIQTEVKKEGKAGQIKSLFLTHTITGKPELVGLENFISLIRITAPSSLIRSLTDEYMVGTYQGVGTGARSHLFLVFQTKDYNQSYAGMLGWERTMFDDLFTLFNIDITENRTDIFETPWKDTLINNKDARVLYDKKGTPLLYYIFFTKDAFIITDDENTIKEVGGRLLTKQIKPL